MTSAKVAPMVRHCVGDVVVVVVGVTAHVAAGLAHLAGGACRGGRGMSPAGGNAPRGSAAAAPEAAALGGELGGELGGTPDNVAVRDGRERARGPLEVNPGIAFTLGGEARIGAPPPRSAWLLPVRGVEGEVEAVARGSAAALRLASSSSWRRRERGGTVGVRRADRVRERLRPRAPAATTEAWPARLVVMGSSVDEASEEAMDAHAQPMQWQNNSPCT